MRYYKTTPYIVDTGIFTDPIMGQLSWQAQPIPADQSKQLVWVQWENENMEESFEAHPLVTSLGFGWEAPTSDVLPLLQSMIQPNSDLLATRGIAIPDTIQPTECLASVLRKVSQTARRIA